MASLHEQIADRHADILAYSRGLEADAQRRVRALALEIAKVLAGRNLSRLSRRELNALIAMVASSVDSAYLLLAKDSEKGLISMMAATTPSLAKLVKSRRRAAPSLAEVLITGATTSELWGSSSESVKRAAIRAIRLAALNEQQSSTDTLFTKNGIFDKAARGAKVNTQAAVLSAETAIKKAVATETSLISGYRFSSMFDSQTCLTCAAMDGKLFDREMVALDRSVRAVGSAPLHFGCRCTMIPELSEEGPASAIAGPDGTVSRGLTFEEWISKKSKRYQEAYFGRGRYELWRKGEITLSDLINGQGRIVTLDELRRKYGN